MSPQDIYSRKLNQLINLRYISQFLSVGAVGAVVDNLVLILVVELTAVPPLLAKGLSAECSIVFMFVVNEYWTFAGHGTNSYLGLFRRLLTSNLVRLGGLAVGFAVLFVLHNQLGVWYLIANIVGIGFGSIVNYFFESLFTWRIA